MNTASCTPPSSWTSGSASTCCSILETATQSPARAASVATLVKARPSITRCSRYGAAMIDLYTWTTPNGFKALIAMEEFAVEHEVHWINIGKGEQMTPQYLAINPNNKIPAIVDRDGPGGKPITVF